MIRATRENIDIGTRVMGFMPYNTEDTKYVGTITKIELDSLYIYIKRDDGRTGGGRDGGWMASLTGRGYGADNAKGELYLLEQKKPKKHTCPECKKKTTASSILCRACDSKPL